MKVDDEAKARSFARDLARSLADKHRKVLERITSSSDVWTELAEPIASARARFSKEAKKFRSRGFFEQSIHEELVAPVDARIDRERADEDRLAVREGAGYREAPPERPPEPKKEKRPEKPQKRSEANDAYTDLRSTGRIFLAIGAFATVGFAILALTLLRKERLVARSQTVYRAAQCTIVESRDVRDPDGGGQMHVFKFTLDLDGKHYVGDRYSPNVDHGPGSQWFPVGRSVDCVYDPEDPQMLFLRRGTSSKTERTNWLYMFVFPLLFLGIGAWMRYAPQSIDRASD